MNRTTMFATVTALVLAAAAIPPAMAQSSAEPSRPAIDGCAWERLADAKVGLSAWVQRCDFDGRKFELKFQDNSVVLTSTDFPEANPVITVLDLGDGETAEQGLRRIYEEHTDAAVAARCVAAPYTLTTAPKGIERFGFVPDATYQAELDKVITDGIPDPACGEWGDQPDGIAYFEIQPESKARKILYVQVGQDEPLFDEDTLLLTAP